jgi:crossover junction endodeoxyribonuclease RuvC
LHVEVLTTASDETHAKRLLFIAAGVESLIKRFTPEVVAVETVFSQHNLRTVIGTAQAAGVVMLAAARGGIEVATHTPTEVKAAVTGSGRASKDQVANMITKIFRLSAPPRPVDATDACALALCHVWRGEMQSRLVQAQQRFLRK